MNETQMPETMKFNVTEDREIHGSALALAPFTGVSPKYTFVPTRTLVEKLRDAGWVVARSQQASVRLPERQGFQKHAVWLRQTAQMRTMADDYQIELLLINAHDGSSSYQLHAAIYRTVCKNGLVCASGTFEAVRFPHRGANPMKVVDASMKLVEAMPRLVERIDQFKDRMLYAPQALELAERALALRYPENPPVIPYTLLRTRRYEDGSGDLWSTMNRVQENLLRGGVGDEKRTPAGRLRTVRPCRGIAASVALNRGLWAIAESYLN